MKRQQLVRYLKKKGCKLKGEGAKHTRVYNPVNGKRSHIPRHVEVANQLARAICRQLGVEQIGKGTF